MLPLLLGVAVLLSLVITPLVAGGATLLEIFDAPSGGRRMHTRPIPRMGGVAVFATMLMIVAVSAWLWGGRPWLQIADYRFLGGVLLGGGMLFAVGLVDDLFDLRPLWKLTAQVIAALVVYQAGFRIDDLSFIPGFHLHLAAVASLALTVFWVVGVTNAFNLIDGLDGLATGVALVALGATAVAAGALGNLQVVVAAIALGGVLLGFLRYNFSPATIFLGDSGSLFVGFMLAVLCAKGADGGDAGMLALVPLCVLAVPLADTSLAIMRRWLRGVPLSGADARHIHHQLLALGFSHRRVALVMYAVAAGVAALGLILVFSPPATLGVLGVLGVLALVAFLHFGLSRLEYHEFSVAGSVVLSAFVRGRGVIRHQIHARDIAGALAHAESLPELQKMLAHAAPQFGFSGMDLCLEPSSAPQPETAWRLDVPLVPSRPVGGGSCVLRIWGKPVDRRLPGNLECVARVLVPTLEERLVSLAAERVDGAEVRSGSRAAPLVGASPMRSRSSAPGLPIRVPLRSADPLPRGGAALE